MIDAWGKGMQQATVAQKMLRKNCFFYTDLHFLQKNVQSSILQMNVSQPVNKSYKVCFHFIISLSILYQKLAKFLWVVDHPGSQAVVQCVGKHQDSSPRCHLLASAFSCNEGKDVLCTAFPPFTVKPLVSTHQRC